MLFYSKGFINYLILIYSLFFLSNTTAISQETLHEKEFICDFWPDNLDGTDHFPNNHRLIFETNLAKVVDVYIPAGTAELPHTHKINSFMILDAATAVVVKNVDAKGTTKIVYKSNLQQDSTASVSQYIPAEPLHFVENIDKKNDYRAIRIEIKKDMSKAIKAVDVKSSVFHRFVKKQKQYAFGNTLLWHLLADNSKPQIHTNDNKLFLISQINSNFIIREKGKQYLSPIEKPKNEIANRPKVWYLNENTTYEIIKTHPSSELIYAVEVH